MKGGDKGLLPPPPKDDCWSNSKFWRCCWIFCCCCCKACWIAWISLGLTWGGKVGGGGKIGGPEPLLLLSLSCWESCLAATAANWLCHKPGELAPKAINCIDSWKCKGKSCYRFRISLTLYLKMSSVFHFREITPFICFVCSRKEKRNQWKMANIMYLI